MKKSNILKVIIFIVFLLILLVIVLVNFINKKKINQEFIEQNNNFTSVKTKYECNEFKLITVTSDELVSIYFNNYMNIVFKDIEQAYNLLDKDYKDKKFGSIEEYKAYIANNKETLYSSKLESYQVKKDGDVTSYICVDQNGRYYIFNETAVMDYTVILDTYTINLPEFMEKYEVATEQQKVALNINKFIQALNEKDYKYAYNCLADSYKNNYFKTQKEFEIYAKENFYKNSRVEYKQFNVESNLYTYIVILTDRTTGQQMSKTFIMQLGEATEFVLSFNK